MSPVLLCCYPRLHMGDNIGPLSLFPSASANVLRSWAKELLRQWVSLADPWAFKAAEHSTALCKHTHTHTHIHLHAALIAHKKFSTPKKNTRVCTAPSPLSNLTRLLSTSQGCEICNRQTTNRTGRKVFHKVHTGGCFIGSFRIRETHSQWERRNTDGILIHRYSLGPPHVLKMVILSNLLVLHRRFDFLESYLTAALASGLQSWKKKKRQSSNLQFIHIGGNV